MQAGDRLTPEQLAAGLAAREKAREAREEARAALMEQHNHEAKKASALFFDEYGSPIDLPTIMEGFARAIDTRIGQVEVQYQQLHTSVEENTELTKKLALDSQPMIEFAKAVSGATKLLNYCKDIAKPVAWVIIAICGIVIMVVGALTALKSGINIPAQK